MPKGSPMKIKTSELSGVALDWAVSQVDEVKTIMLAPKNDEPKKPFALFGSLAIPVGGDSENSYSPSTCWHCGGPLIERFHIDFTFERVGVVWAELCGDDGSYCSPFAGVYGSTHLIAACRAIVLANLGDEVDVPEGLV